MKASAPLALSQFIASFDKLARCRRARRSSPGHTGYETFLDGVNVLNQIADVLRGTQDRREAIDRLNDSPFEAADLDGAIIRVKAADLVFYVELHPLRSVPVADISFEGVFVQPAVVFWPFWLIYTDAAELALVVRVETPARPSKPSE
jgi:hypothetical protein